MKTNPAKRVAANVRAELARADISQTAIASAIAISQSAVARRLAGEVPFRVDELYGIANVCGIPVSTLIPDVSNVA